MVVPGGLDDPDFDFLAAIDEACEDPWGSAGLSDAVEVPGNPAPGSPALEPNIGNKGHRDDKNSDKGELGELDQAWRELLSYSSYSHVDC